MFPKTPKYFNTAGPCDPNRHYMLSAVKRLPEARQLIDEGHYFIIHAARQSSKTTLLQALTDEINNGGNFKAIYCSLEAIQGFDAADNGIKHVAALLRAVLKLSSDPKVNADGYMDACGQRKVGWLFSIAPPENLGKKK